MSLAPASYVVVVGASRDSTGITSCITSTLNRTSKLRKNSQLESGLWTRSMTPHKYTTKTIELDIEAATVELKLEFQDNLFHVFKRC
eukprot:3808881-Amphidinium_carterae.1